MFAENKRCRCVSEAFFKKKTSTIEPLVSKNQNIPYTKRIQEHVFCASLKPNFSPTRSSFCCSSFLRPSEKAGDVDNVVKATQWIINLAFIF